jgi:hypothetical protein
MFVLITIRLEPVLGPDLKAEQRLRPGIEGTEKGVVTSIARHPQ